MSCINDKTSNDCINILQHKLAVIVQRFTSYALTCYNLAPALVEETWTQLTCVFFCKKNVFAMYSYVITSTIRLFFLRYDSR